MSNLFDLNTILLYCTHIKYHINSRRRTVTNWYVGKIILFLNFNFSKEVGSRGSTYALLEPMAEHQVSSLDHTIPKVKAFKNQDRKFVLIDADEVECSVGLLTEVTCSTAESHSRRRVETGTEKTFKYVIRPGEAFPKNLKSILGKISNLSIQ